MDAGLLTVDEESDAVEPGRLRRFLLVLAALLLGALLLVWTQRKPIAGDFIDRELARRDVPARYEITRLGFRTQRLERVSIGDPANPDLTAEWAEVGLVVGLGGPRVRSIAAYGVRVRGRLVDGVVRMGAVDRLLPPPSGKPFSLPDLAVVLSDARMRLETPVGAIGLRLDGAGNLADGFKGKLIAAAPRIDVNGCAASGMTASLALSIEARRPHLTGPVRATRLECPGTSIAIISPDVQTDVTLSEALDRWTGNARVAARESAVAGWGADRVNGRVDFAGRSGGTGGTILLAAADVAGSAGAADRIEVEGRYRLGGRAVDRLPDDPVTPTGTRYGFDGTVEAAGVAGPDRIIRAFAGFSRAAAGTPVAPIGALIGPALVRNARRFDASARIAVAGAGGTGSLSAESLAVDASAGARLRLTGGEGVRLLWPGSGRWLVDGRLTLAGGGLPGVTADLRQTVPGGAITGLARIAPMSANGARLALAPVRFEAGKGATRLITRVSLDGPVGGGRVTGLVLPVDARFRPGGFVINPRCAPIAFESLAIAGLTLQPARLRLCPVGGGLLTGRGGGARVDAPRLAGRLSGTPITLAARGADVRSPSGGFTVTGLEARLGGGDRVSRLDVARLDGRSGEGGLSGRFTGASGQIARVPLLIGEAGGAWRLAGSVLTVGGGLRLADEANPPRFNPLASEDFTLRIDGDRLSAAGTLAEPASKIAVTRVAIQHSLRGGTGRAELDVPGIAFGRALQPEKLTRLTLGVVANVEGTLSGRGEVRWSPAAVTSTGLFRTSDTALAAAFGPVTGLSGEIRFSDLLGLETPPGQVMRIRTVNPGILVENGVVRYQLLPGLRIGIEDGMWPLAGGTLALRPTVLAFGEDVDRRLTFDVTALDAAKFINKLEFENISATGIFDGALPMVFDADGGRIVDGALVARAPGGTLAYIGEVSNADLGIWGGIAFDALKSIAYENLTIDLNGDLDGEMVTQVRFLGVSRGTIEPVATGLLATIGGRLASQLQALPFRFNIRIAAPFRGLIATSRSFGDPSGLIRDSLPPGLDATAQPVQPQESETKR